MEGGGYQRVVIPSSPPPLHVYEERSQLMRSGRMRVGGRCCGEDKTGSNRVPLENDARKVML